jgi:splicing factor 3A subunit 3
MDSIIETQRQTHEEIERYETALYSLLSRNQPTHEIKLQTEHKAAQVLDRISSRVTALHNYYLDEDVRKAEIGALSAPAAAQNDLSEFYARLVKIQDHYNKYPDAVPGGFELELAAILEEGNQDGLDDDYEEEDRALTALLLLHGLTFVFQLYLYSSLVKKHTESTSICMRITLRTTT